MCLAADDCLARLKPRAAEHCSQATRLHMHLQALGESVIRKALEELQIWGLERRFTLYQYTSTADTR